MYFCFPLAGQSSICYRYLQCRSLSWIQQLSLWTGRCLEVSEMILMLGWGWKEMKYFRDFYGFWGRKSEITHRAVEDKNLRLATYLLTLQESTRSAGQWFGLKKSLLLPFTQELETYSTRCSFWTLQEGLISKTEVDTSVPFLWLYGFCMNTDLFPGWKCVVKLPRLVAWGTETKTKWTKIPKPKTIGDMQCA